MKIPNAKNAFVEVSKLRDYCLNPSHEVGKHKARVFASALGLSRNDVLVLRDALLSAVKTNEAVAGKANKFGKRYILDFDFEHADKIARIRSVWIVDAGAEIPRLVTCLVL